MIFISLPRLVAGLMAVAGSASIVLAQPQRPNIVLVVADDLAWSDLGCQGHPYHETPNLDRLAREGMRFTQAYAPAPICSASRAALLTGKTPARLHFEFVTKDQPGRQKGRHPLQSPPYTMNLPLAEVTVAEVLAPAGYATGFFGKWHLNQHHGGYLGWSPTHGPLQQGYGTGSAEFGGHPYAYLKSEGPAYAELAEGVYPRDRLTDQAIEFARQAKPPFFLHLCHYQVHDPIHTRAKWLHEKYRRKLPAGADEVRAMYGAMVETLDHEVGRLLAALDEAGLTKNTLVVFTSDNGGHPDYTGNAPFRGSKWNLYEGGIRTPLFIRWPGHVAAGTTNDTPVTGCDFLPTFAAVANAPPDAARPIDGVSLLPLLGSAEAELPERPLIWHFPYYHPERKFAEAPAKIGVNDFATSQTRPHSAIRLGHYKLLLFHEDARSELYRLSADPGEQHDLSTSEPERATALRKKLTDYLKSVRARMPE